jgi:LPXTG-motif cell wall-anchored protein
MTDILSGMQYPHWLMVVGAALLLLGLVGLAFGRNRNGKAGDRELPATEANGE